MTYLQRKIQTAQQQLEIAFDQESGSPEHVRALHNTMAEVISALSAIEDKIGRLENNV